MKRMMSMAFVLSFLYSCDFIKSIGEPLPDEVEAVEAAEAKEAADVAAVGEKKAVGAEAKAEVEPEVESVASVEAIEGAPTVERAGETLAAKPGLAVLKGDVLVTNAKAKVRLKFPDASLISLGGQTRMKIENFDLGDERRGKLVLEAGRFWFKVSKWLGTSKSLVEVDTPNAVAGIRGTTLWGDTKVDAICALEGSIEVRSKKRAKLRPKKLKANQCASKLSKGQLKSLNLKPRAGKKYLKEVLIAEKP